MTPSRRVFAAAGCVLLVVLQSLNSACLARSTGGDASNDVRDTTPLDAESCSADASVQPVLSPWCDGLLRNRCMTWVQSLVNSGIAYSTCQSWEPYPPPNEICHRASVCDRNATPPCRCGDEPECALGEVCWAAGQSPDCGAGHQCSPGDAAEAPRCHCLSEFR